MATVVSSHLASDAQGRKVGPVLIVTDVDGFVCDLEVDLVDDAAEVDLGEAEVPDQSELLPASVATSIRMTYKEPTVTLMAPWLLIRFADSDGGSWRQVGDQPLYLRLTGKDLLAIAVRDLRDDPNGSAESAWLDELEGPREAGKGARVTT